MQSSEAVISVLAAWLHDMDAAEVPDIPAPSAPKPSGSSQSGVANVNVEGGEGGSGAGGSGACSGTEGAARGGLRSRFLSQIDQLRQRWAEEIPRPASPPRPSGP